MSVPDISEFSSITEKLHQLKGNLFDETSSSAVAAASYDRAYERLQSALAEVKSDPGNSAKSKSLKRATDTYQTSVEMMVFKAQALIEQARNSGVDTAALQSKCGAFISELFPDSGSKNH